MIICNNYNLVDGVEVTRVTGVTRGEGTERGSEGKGKVGEEIFAHRHADGPIKGSTEVLANLKSKCFNNKDEICIHYQ